jgi:hypothetical protein
MYTAYIIGFGQAREVKELEWGTEPTWSWFSRMASTAAVAGSVMKKNSFQAWWFENW